MFTLAVSRTAHAQSTPYQVFKNTSTEGNTVGQDTLTFVNLLTGETRTATAYGNNYTVINDELIYYDRLENEVMLLQPDGRKRRHPFIQLTANARRLDWVVSTDKRYIAWTITEGTSDALTTFTYVARTDGSDMKEVLTDGPRNGIYALPLAFSADDTALYMDYQPEALGNYTPYSEYAGLFEIRFKDESDVIFLPGEPGCFCGAGFGGEFFLRLALSDDLSGFNLRVVHLPSEAESLMDALPLQNYTQGGDILVSPDGTRAVYALAQVNNFGGPEQSVRTVFVLVNLDSMTQTQLIPPLNRFLRPVAWTENNTAVIFTSPVEEGTWKIVLENERLEPVASATYLGMLGD